MSSSEKFEMWFYLVGGLIVVAIFVAMLPNWMKGDEERAVLASAGYTEVKLDGFRVLDCPDLFGMGFEAKGPSGAPAKGAVCRGIFSGASIRLKN